MRYVEGHGLVLVSSGPVFRVELNNTIYSELSRSGHLAIMDTPMMQAAAKFPAKIKYRRLTEINSRYYGLSLVRTLTRGSEGVHNKGS